MAKAKDKDDPFRLMGLAIEYIKTLIHVLKSSKKAADEVLETLGVDDPILAIAKKLEALALEDEYFKSRSLYPNVDFILESFIEL
jgi:citrate synthase